MFSKRWIARNLFDLSEEDYLRNQREMFYDASFARALEMGAQAEMAAGGMGGMGGMGGGMGALGGEEMGGGEGMPPPGEEGAVPEEEPTAGPPPGAEGAPEAESALLAAPGKRDDKAWMQVRVKPDGSYTTPGSKGKAYKRVTADKRQSGARKRHFRAQGSHELARMPSRQTRMLPSGARELLGLGKGISEDKETNYNNEERALLETNQNIKNLIQELEQKDDAKTQ
jgi:hypothetical protein